MAKGDLNTPQLEWTNGCFKTLNNSTYLNVELL